LDSCLGVLFMENLDLVSAVNGCQSVCGTLLSYELIIEYTSNYFLSS
jgi:hypothetical protein